MLPLILLLAAFALFAGFLFLRRFEERRGKRVLEGARGGLDREVVRLSERASRADLGAAVSSGIRRGAERIAHDAAHLSLIGVRAAERALTSAVRTLRTKRAESAAAPQAPSFASTMKDFKNELRNGNGSGGEKGSEVSSSGDSTAGVA